MGSSAFLPLCGQRCASSVELGQPISAWRDSELLPSAGFFASSANRAPPLRLSPLADSFFYFFFLLGELQSPGVGMQCRDNSSSVPQARSLTDTTIMHDNAKPG